jgi:hypothetical protein
MDENKKERIKMEPFQNKIKEIEKEIKRFEYLDNLGQHILPVNPDKKDNWYEWIELKRKLPILKSNLKLLKDLQKQIRDKITNKLEGLSDYHIESRHNDMLGNFSAIITKDGSEFEDIGKLLSYKRALKELLRSLGEMK